MPVPLPGPRPGWPALAPASLWIYLTHWQVYPGLEAAGHQGLAVLASIAVGLVALRAQVWLRLRATTHRLVRPAARLPSGSGPVGRQGTVKTVGTPAPPDLELTLCPMFSTCS